MLLLHLSLLILIGLIGMVFNWLLILAIQRKTYHYQYSHRPSNPIVSRSILRSNSSTNGQINQTPLLPSVRSSISIFDKFILAFLINDMFVCNFLLPLRFIDLSQGLPCGFLCFLFKFFEKLTTITELIIINLLLITSLISFWKKRFLSTKFRFILILLITPILTSYLLTTLTYLDVEEYQANNRPPTCKQTYIYISKPTRKTLNIFCCLITYVMIVINFILLIKTKSAIKTYKKNALKTLTEAVVSNRTDAPATQTDQAGIEFSNRRRSMYFSASFTTESSSTNPPPSNSRSPPTIDYPSYLTAMENSQTLVRSTCLILLIYLFVHIPYWFDEFFHWQLFNYFKDIFFLCHILKPFCYMLTNERYRHHIWAILKCKTFRMLPNLLRQKSRMITKNNTHSFSLPTN